MSHQVSSVQNPGWSMIIRDYTTLHILGIKIIQERGIPIFFKHPGLNGMIEGWLEHCSSSVTLW